MADWFDQQGIDLGGGGRMYAGGSPTFDYSGGGRDPSINPEGAAYDPFAYTKGSLLTPWEGKFTYTGGDGGSGVPEFRAFEYGDFNFRAANPGTFQERYADPGNFVYGEYQSGPAFRPPTEADMRSDPGFEARMKAGQRALMASKAAQGIAKTGGTAKALMKYGQEFASNEYDKVYGRRLAEHDRTVDEGRFSYGTNRANAAENFDRNVANARTAYQVRQGAWKDNAAVTLDASRHGYDVAQGVYDRNLSLARTKYDDERAHASAVASAARAAADRDYARQLSEYQMSRDEFWTNQDRQYSILDREANRGYDAALRYAGMTSDLATGGANARAAGVVGAANARSAAAGSIGNTVSDLALFGATYQAPRPQYNSYWNG